MSIYEYDEEDHKRILREEGWEEGRAQGKAESVLELLEDLGPVPAQLRERIMQVRDLDELHRLHRLAAHVGNLEEFVRLSGETDRK